MKRYGLVGERLDYSYSKIIHEYLIEKMNLDATYELIETKELVNLDLTKYDGLNFTIPYKEEILGLILNRSDAVNISKSANLLSDQKLYNTDTNGFIELINKLNVDMTEINRIIILGNSKTSRTIKYLFSDKDVQICSRKQRPGCITYDQEDLLYGDLIVNTTILGMDKYCNISPVDEEIFKRFKYAIDVNYNPMRNQFLMDASLYGLENINGLRMLIVQAIRSFEIWHDVVISKDVYDDIYHFLVQKETIGTVFIGMPYSGKTFLCKMFAQKGLDVIDTDQEITNIYKMTPQEIINKEGEDYFRKLESDLFNDLLKQGKKYIFTGGGIVKNLDNIRHLDRYDVVLIDTPIDVLVDRFMKNPDNRALLKTSDDLIKLYNNRRKNYEIFANRKLRYDEIINLKWT